MVSLAIVSWKQPWIIYERLMMAMLQWLLIYEIGSRTNLAQGLSFSEHCSRIFLVFVFFFYFSTEILEFICYFTHIHIYAQAHTHTQIHCEIWDGVETVDRFQRIKICKIVCLTVYKYGCLSNYLRFL